MDTILKVAVYGIFPLLWWQYVLITLTLTHVTIVAVTIYLHRYSAHQAIELSPVVSHFFRFWLWMTTGMNTKEWTAIHRKHHAKCETPDDPHSPQTRGIGTVFWKGTELYRSEAKNTETLARYGHGTPNDWIEQNLYSRFSWHGIVLMLVVNLALFGPIGLTIWAIQMLWIPIFAAGIINGVGHYWGYRNADTPDTSTNIVPWGFVIGGEELHNNHHNSPTSAKFSLRSWEFDLGWLYIRAMEICGLARVKHAMFPPTKERRYAPDTKALNAFLVYRYLIVWMYRKVLLRVIKKTESEVALDEKFLLQRLRGLLQRDGGWKLHHERFSEYKEVRDALRGRESGVYGLLVLRDQLDVLLAGRGDKSAGFRDVAEWLRSVRNLGGDDFRDFMIAVSSMRVHRIP